MTSTSSSQYLASKTASLESQSPVPPSQARAAQIPLQAFDLPIFPPEAFSAGLTSLILTSDIKLDDYTSILTSPFTIPDLPPSIKTLTLELFSLGYPASFLTTLGQKLPHLKSLTLYSQLFLGTTPETRDDALAFIKAQSSLQELHLLDVFASPGQLANFNAALSPALKFLEINYTYRHSDPQFLASLPTKDFPGFIGKNLVGLTLSISAPDITDDEDDREGTEVGILPVSGREAREVVEKLVNDAGNLMMLDITLFEMTSEEVGKVLDANDKIKVFGFTVGVESGWDEVFQMLESKERGFEVLEIVAVPAAKLVESLKKDDASIVIMDRMLSSLGRACKNLKSVKVSILRTKTQKWTKEGGIWTQS